MAPRTIPIGTSTMTIGGLTANTTYHYRFVASNAHGASVSESRSFTTKPPVAKPPEPKLPEGTPPAKVTISLPSNRRCRTSRTLAIRVRIGKGGTIKAAEVRVDRHRKLRLTKAKDLRRSIKVSKLPNGSYRLEVRVLTKDGRTVTASKRYRTCATRR